MNNKENIYTIAAWRTIEKKKKNVYLFVDLIIIGLGVLIIAILIFIILNGFREIFGLIFLTVIGLLLISIGCIPIFFQKKNPNTPVIEGFLRFNSEVIEFINEKNGIKIQIPLDSKTYFYPLVCNAFTNELCGLQIRREKEYLVIEPFLGYSWRDIQNELPTLIYFAKKKNVKFNKYWKRVRY